MTIPDSGLINTAFLSAYEVYNGLSPLKKPRAIRLPLDFNASNFGELKLDLEYVMMQDKLEFVQSMYVDNSLNANAISITFAISNQTITIPAQSQGYVSVLCPGAPSLVAETSPDYTGVVPIFLMSFPVANVIWST